MEMDLNNLIEKIKKDGVGEAQKKSADIINDAQKKAQEIIAHAHTENKNIILEAETESNKLKKLAEASIKQSVRDAALSLKQKIVELCDTITKRQITQQMSPSVLKDIILKLIENFKKEGILNIEILLKKEDKEKLEETVLGSLAAEMKKGITFKISPSISAGLRIGERDKNYYYDFTDEGLMEALRAYLNPKVLKILDTNK